MVLREGRPAGIEEGRFGGRGGTLLFQVVGRLSCGGVAGSRGPRPGRAAGRCSSHQAQFLSSSELTEGHGRKVLALWGVLRTPAKGSEILSSKAVRDDVQYSSNVHFLPDHSDRQAGVSWPGPWAVA